MGASPDGRFHDAADAARPILCLQLGGCPTFCANGGHGQPAASFHVPPTAAADDDDGPTATTAFKSFWQPIWSRYSTLWPRYACRVLQSTNETHVNAIYRKYVLSAWKLEGKTHR